MSDQILMGVHTKEADQYAEALLVHHNLERALACAELCKAQYSSIYPLSNQDLLIHNGLLSHAANLIVAAFTTSNPFHLNIKEVFPENNDATVAYASILDVRNGFFAHTYNPMRQAFFGVFLNDQYDIIRCGQMLMVHDRFPQTFNENLGNIIVGAGKYLEQLMPRLYADAMSSAQKLTLEERKNLSAATGTVPGPEDLKKGRNAFRTNSGRERRSRSKRVTTFKPDVSVDDFEKIQEIVEHTLIEKGSKIDPDKDGRLITNKVLSELGKRGYVVMKPKEESV